MGLFDDMLHSDQTLFKEEAALDFSYVPKILPYREKEQRTVASAIKPLLSGHNGKSILVHGPPGIGKTAAVKWVLRELEDDHDEVMPIFVNCWQKNTTFKVYTEMCDQLSLKFIQNKKSEELFALIKKELNKNPAVFIFDEIDKVEDTDFLYAILEEIFRKTIVLITNYKGWLATLDERIRSRLMAELLGFAQYSYPETEGIIKERAKYAFVPGAFETDATKLIVDKTFETRDIRTGLYLMKEAGLAAETASSKKIAVQHVKEAVKKVDEFSINSMDALDSECKGILDFIKKNPGQKMGDLHRLYCSCGKEMTYKTFTRRIKALEKGKFISLDKITGGTDGSTTIVNTKEATKKLTEF